MSRQNQARSLAHTRLTAGNFTTTADILSGPIAWEWDMFLSDFIDKLLDIQAEDSFVEKGEVRIALSHGSDIAVDRIELDGNGQVYLHADGHPIGRN